VHSGDDEIVVVDGAAIVDRNGVHELCVPDIGISLSLRLELYLLEPLLELVEEDWMVCRSPTLPWPSLTRAESKGEERDWIRANIGWSG